MKRRFGRWALVYAGGTAVVAACSGVIWNRSVVLPSYQIGEDFRARISEAGLSQIPAIDVHFALIGAIAGVILGTGAFFLFREWGWPATAMAGFGSGLAGVMARIIAEFIGPREFQVRVAQATQGELVQVDFAAHSWIPLAVWVGTAMVPVIIGSVVWRPARVESDE